MKETELQNKSEFLTVTVFTDMFTKAMDKIDRRFIDIDRQFISIDERFASIDRRFASIDERFVSIDGQFTAMGKRFNHLEQKMMDGFDSLDRKIDLVENNLVTRFDREEAFV